MHQYKASKNRFKKELLRLIIVARNSTDSIMITKNTTNNRNGMKNSGYFKQQISEISHKKILKWQRNGNIKIQTQSIHIANRNRSETIYQIINECSILTQKESQTRYDRMRKPIHRELCKRFKFDHSARWYIQQPESVLEDQTQQFPWILR